MKYLSILIPARKKRIFSEEHRRKISIALNGKISVRKGKKYVDPLVSKEKRKAYKKEWVKLNKDKVLKHSREAYKKNITKKRAMSREFYWNNKQSELDRIRFKKYGITGEEYRAIVEKQNGKCLICKNSDIKNLSVDHCHTTGKVRGVICNSCNMALGNVKDSIKTLRNLANYLEKNI